jgi:N-acyl-D-aspartate/D-glutamate deacylase
MIHGADLVIRNGTIFDGTGGVPYVGTIAVKDGLIVQGSSGTAQGKEEIDARGLMVTPGFVDVHTHYDAQLTWSNRISPSSSHGVTTVVTGNCGVGFAPCRPEDRARLIRLLEGVEDMPEIVLAEGLPWDWESFPEFVAAISRRAHDIDFAVQLPHAAVRVFVMGERAVDGAASTEGDRREMRRIAAAAIRAGALGFGTSRNVGHRANDGSVIPTAHSEEPELLAIAKGMEDAGGGVIQAILSIRDPIPDFELFRRIASQTNSPFSFTLLEMRSAEDEWRELLARVEQANRVGGPLTTAQVFPRSQGFLMGLNLSMHPFSTHPTYERLALLPFAARVEELRRPEVRAAILAERPREPMQPFHMLARQFDAIYPLGRTPDYEPPPDRSLQAIAETRGRTADEVAYGCLLEGDGNGLLLMTAVNYVGRNLDHVREMLVHPHTVPALGDGGAHYGLLCDSTYPTFMLSHWGRDRRTGRIPLEEIVRRLSSLPAAMVGMRDRGAIRPGLKADLNIIDFDRLKLHAPEVRFDMPAAGRRVYQAADGFVATIVSGEIIQRDGEPTKALPGRLATRSGRPAVKPAAAESPLS